MKCFEKNLKCFLVYKFTCACCSSNYIGETCRHFKTRIKFSLFQNIDKANSKFDLKIKEALHFNWRKPNLNVQQNHLALTLLL